MKTFKLGSLFQSRVVAVAPDSEQFVDGRRGQNVAMRSFKAAALESATEIVSRDQACGVLLKSGFVFDPDSILKTMWDVICKISSPRFTFAKRNAVCKLYSDTCHPLHCNYYALQHIF
jgi:uncharacterized membrane-anchored protein